ncbi:MAG: hypothetical protein ACXW4Z_23550, partial [Candidatus Binatia bacterium]
MAAVYFGPRGRFRYSDFGFVCWEFISDLMLRISDFKGDTAMSRRYLPMLCCIGVLAIDSWFCSPAPAQ